MDKPRVSSPRAKMARFYKFWFWLTEPPTSFSEGMRHAQMRLLTIFLVFLLLIFAGIDTIFMLTVPAYQIPWYGYIFLGVAFLLNRQGFYILASGVVLAMFPLVVFILVISGTSGEPLNIPNYLIIGLLLSSMLVSQRGILILGLVNLIEILLFPVIAPEVFPRFNAILSPFTINLIALPLILVAIHHRNEIENKRHAELGLVTERLQLALSSARMGTWDWNILTNQVLWSEHVAEIFGLSEGAFDGQYESYLKLIFPEDLAMVQQTIVDTLSGKSEDYVIEHRILWPDGSLNWLEGRGRVYRDSNGNPIRMTGTVTGITAQKQTDEVLKRYTKRLEILHEIESGLLSAESPQAIAEMAAENVRRLAACERVSICLFDFHSRQVSFLAVSSFRPTLIPAGAILPMEYYGLHIIEAHKRGEPYITEDIRLETPDVESEHRFTADQIRAWLCMPLFYHGDLIGALNLGHVHPKPFTQEQEEIAREVANQLAIALHQSRLTNETTEALLREQRLNKVAQTISSTLDLQTILPTIIRLATELIGAEAGSMSLISPDGQTLLNPHFWHLSKDLGLEQPIPKGVGVAWRIIESKKGVLVRNYRKDPDALPQWIKAGVHGLIEVPLISGDVCLGTLGLYLLDPEKRFNLRDLALAESIGQQAGIAVQNAQLFEASRRQLQELTVLRAVAAAGAAATNEDDLLAKVAQIVHEALYPDIFGIGLWDETTAVLRPHPASHGLPEALAKSTFTLNEGISGTVAARRQPWRVPDVRQEPAFYAYDSEIMSELAVPILAGEKLIGIIDVESIKLDAFSEADERLLMTLAGQLAAAIERLRAEASLRANETRHREMLEKVILLGKAITQITDFQACLRQIHQSIQKGLGFDRVGLFLYDQQTDNIQGTYGTSVKGEMEDTSWFMQSANDFQIWRLVLEEPRGIQIIDHYDQKYELSEDSEMYGVKQHVTLAARVGEKPVALIAVDNVMTKRHITHEHIEALQLFAGYVGLAIENARWSTELEQRVTERTAQLEIANQELESFSYSVSHDLRAPLRAIDGFSSILNMVYGHQFDTEGQRYLKHIRDNVSRMSQLINDLLAFSRLGRQPLNKQLTDPLPLVRQVLDDLMGDLAGRDIDIQLGQLPPCQADPSLLQQVFANLIGNAVKYSRPREKAIIYIDWKRENGETVYFIQDNGVGFDMKYANKLFGVFQRFHSFEAFEGTGIGLAIVHRIVYRHGGRIWANADVDTGATFFFTLG